MNLELLNQSDKTKFVEYLGGIFEHSPWVAEAVYAQLPFASRDALHGSMVAAMRSASEACQLTLLRAHPELAGKEASKGTLTAESTREQAGAGLDQCSADELRQIQQLNREYRERFDFPFIIAVTGLDKHQVIAAMRHRIGNQANTEFDAALAEVEKIAKIRIDALIDA